VAKTKPFNLFVYGTLMNPSVFRAVTGLRLVRRSHDADNLERFAARRAVLDGYKKVSFDNTYQYAVPERHGRIRGFVIGPMQGEVMARLREYEGRNYSKRVVRPLTKDGPVEAVAFVGNLRQLEHSFGYPLGDPLKQEILLGRKIERALIETEREKLHTTECTLRRAVGELRGATIRDLVRRHFEAGGISDYAIRHSLKDAPLPDYSRISGDAEAQALAPNYLDLVVRQVLFNQIEEHVRTDFRYEIDHMSPGPGYYERTLSSLAALRILNESASLLDMLAGDCLTELSFERDHLVDFVRWAVSAADEVYDARAAKRELAFIRNHMGHGYIALGAELEFSNIGHGVISDPKGRFLRDRDYDGFLYFGDFGLDALTWKLGGHIDDHHDKVSAGPRRGFFEVALGSLSIAENISKPITDDPWTLSQFIHETRQFYPIAPHSVHLSLQIRRQHKPDLDRLLPLTSMQCLFALAGDPERSQGTVRIRRLAENEIIATGKPRRMLFSEITVRRSSQEDDPMPGVRAPSRGGRYVQQFRFLRLSPRVNYEPVILALKGIQINVRPGSFLTATQWESSPRHRRLFEKLTEWGTCPTPIPEEGIERFLKTVRDGLMTERRGKPAHSEAYIMWAVSQLRRMLDRFNRLVTAGS